MSPHETIVDEVLQKHGLANPTEIIAGLVWLLREEHLLALASPDGPVDSLAETLRFNAASAGSMIRKKAEASGVAGRMVEAAKYDRYAVRLQALVDVLDYYLPSWNAEGPGQIAARRRLLREDRTVAHSE